MKNTVVIYESKYGHTKCYAEWIANTLSCPIFERKKFQPQNFSDYDTIIYGGGLYAGGVSGIKLLTQNYPQLAKKRVVLFTCGLASTDNPANADHIRQALSQVLSPDMMKHFSIFHLRGGIDYSKLSFLHKIMMRMMYKMLSKKDASELTEEDNGFLETYGKSVDFSDKNTIAPIIDYVLHSSKL